MKGKLQKQIAELEALETRTPEQDVELQRAKQELTDLSRRPEFHAPECQHTEADLGAKYCSQCGEPLPALPLKAINRIVAEKVAEEIDRRGIGVEGVEGDDPAAPTEEQLREQFSALEKAA